MRLLITVLLAIALPVFAQEDVYRWVDSQGRTHYGNRPPPNVQAERANLSSQPVTVNAGEQVYTWTDERGNIHYGDHPPSNRQAQHVDTDTMPMSTIHSTDFRSGEQQLLDQLKQQKR